MKPPLVRNLATYVIAGAYGALMGLSITRTKTFSSDQGFLFSLVGVGIALIGVFLAQALSGHIIVSLPPIKPRQLLGLKIFFSGFFVAINGWLVATLIHIDAGIRIAVLGIVIGFVGMGVHFVLGFKRNHG
jgi:hypothetical protein